MATGFSLPPNEFFFHLATRLHCLKSLLTIHQIQKPKPFLFSLVYCLFKSLGVNIRARQLKKY
ncbi:hypothetical protein BpHYR1_023114 [Brachionus plicatilis]|uniref:Uncharacterized protein n=1 Tax=Brachionus plicatilis TaxID=10195 RepID=A0A3M7SAX4_BRAPC|nr:hypothetical protein BpHYR1_023114 [Brachionus plicatilis]